MLKYFLQVGDYERRLISEAAHDRWIQDGQIHGRDKAHWKAAEKEVLARLEREHRKRDIAFGFYLRDNCVNGLHQAHWDEAEAQLQREEAHAECLYSLDSLKRVLACVLLFALLVELFERRQ